MGEIPVGVERAVLRLDLFGDVADLTVAGQREPFDDLFWNGEPWSVDLSAFAGTGELHFDVRISGFDPDVSIRLPAPADRTRHTRSSPALDTAETRLTQLFPVTAPLSPSGKGGLIMHPPICCSAVSRPRSPSPHLNSQGRLDMNPNPHLTRRNLLRSAGLLGGTMIAAPWLAAAATTAVAAGPPTAARPPAAHLGPVTLDFWTHDPGYVKTYTAMTKTYTDPFQYTLKTTSLAADAVVTKMLAQAQAKTGTPDVVGVEVSQFPRTMKGNIAKSIFVNWTELLTDEQKGDLLRQADYAPTVRPTASSPTPARRCSTTGRTCSTSWASTRRSRPGRNCSRRGPSPGRRSGSPRTARRVTR